MIFLQWFVIARTATRAVAIQLNFFKSWFSLT